MTTSDTHGKDTPQPGWERELLERMAIEQIKEQRRARRWGIFFKLFFVLYLLVLLGMFQTGGIHPISGKHTALIDIKGVIGQGKDIDADRVITGLRAASKEKDVKGIILRINSPGGSPVQAGYINDEIVRLRAKYPDRPIYAVISDIGASGGYYAAVAADAIYANQASIVGSIGVLMDGFGFVGSIEKLGIERRLLTAGAHKGFMDPFSPLSPEDKVHAQRLLDQVHKQFIKVVQKGRGKKLVHDQDLFSGLFWTGEQAVKLGLVDKLASASYVAREVIGAEEIVDYTPKEDIFDRVTRGFGVALVRVMREEAMQRLLSMQLSATAAAQ